MTTPSAQRPELATLAEEVRRGARSAEEIALATLDRIERLDGDLGAFLATDRELTLAAARAVDRQVAGGTDPGPLAGVPFAIKDNLCLRGLSTTCGSRMLAGWRPPYDAEAVVRALAAGAVPVGKTNLDEFAMGASNEWSAFGPTRNPWRRERVPGGSSGGSAAAVAAGLAAFALGSDTGGSVRQPAAYCGVVGAVGTYGRVSRRGLVAFASSLDRVGVLAPTVREAALVLEVVAGHDPGDATSLAEAMPGRAAWPRAESLRIGVLPCPPAAREPVRRALTAAAGALRDAGAEVVPVSLDRGLPVVETYHLVAASEAASNLARYDGIRFGRTRAETPQGMQHSTRETRAAGFGPEVRRRILLGTYALSAGVADALYEQAARVRRLIADDLRAAFERADVLLGATTASTAFRLGERTHDPLSLWREDEPTAAASLAGLPAVSVPVGLDARGLPIGLQAVAPAGREDLVFSVAAAVERPLPPCPVEEGA